MFYLVFGSVKRPLMGGSKYLDWSGPENPLGVYEADNPEDACQLAAADAAGMGTFFAVEGHPWGVELMKPTGGRFGSTDSPLDQLAGKLDKFDQILERMLPRGDE